MALKLGESYVIMNPSNTKNQNITKIISNYIFKFDDKIGQGNFSKVYKGYHQLTNQEVAIKIIQLQSLKSPKLQELLFSQIQVIQSLNHTNILKCYQVLKSQNNCYIITQLCNGGDLQTLLKKEICLDQNKAATYIRDIFKGLLYLGQRGIVHRDLKIANVFLHNGVVKIADFGFAKYTNNQNFKDLDIGSPLYMSPQGMIDHLYGMKTDIWAFGVIIYQLFHGKTPFQYCKTQFDLKRAVSMPMPLNNFRPDLRIQIRQLILKCLTINFDQRPDALSLRNDSYLIRLLNGAQYGQQYSNINTNTQLNQYMHQSQSMNNFNININNQFNYEQNIIYSNRKIQPQMTKTNYQKYSNQNNVIQSQNQNMLQSVHHQLFQNINNNSPQCKTISQNSQKQQYFIRQPNNSLHTNKQSPMHLSFNSPNQIKSNRQSAYQKQQNSRQNLIPQQGYQPQQQLNSQSIQQNNNNYNSLKTQSNQKVNQNQLTTANNYNDFLSPNRPARNKPIEEKLTNNMLSPNISPENRIHSSSMSQLNGIKVHSNNNLQTINNNNKAQTPKHGLNFSPYRPNPVTNSAYILNNPKKLHKNSVNSHNTSINIVKNSPLNSFYAEKQVQKTNKQKDYIQKEKQQYFPTNNLMQSGMKKNFSGDNGNSNSLNNKKLISNQKNSFQGINNNNNSIQMSIHHNLNTANSLISNNTTNSNKISNAMINNKNLKSSQHSNNKNDQLLHYSNKEDIIIQPNSLKRVFKNFTTYEQNSINNLNGNNFNTSNNVFGNRKFGEIIKGDKSKNLGQVKSTFKMEGNNNNNALNINSYNKNDIQKLKTKSHLIYQNKDPFLKVTATSENVNRKKSPSLNNINQIQDNKVKLPIFIQDKIKQTPPGSKKNIVSTVIDFKQAVSLLHYCRLVFRFISTLKKIKTYPHIKDIHLKSIQNPQTIDIFSRYLLTVLNQLIQNVKSKQIIYQGQNYKKKQIQEQKLKQVTQEYYRKYYQEINKNRQNNNFKCIYPLNDKSTSLEWIKQFCEELWQCLDHQSVILKQRIQRGLQSNQSFIKNFKNLCYLSIRFVQANNILLISSRTKRYTSLSQAVIQGWILEDFYTQQQYQQSKNKYFSMLNETNPLKISQTNDTQDNCRMDSL